MAEIGLATDPADAAEATGAHTEDDALLCVQLRRELREPLSAALGRNQEPYGIELLCEPKDVADDPAKLLVTGRGSSKLAVVLVTPEPEPEEVLQHG